jgi:hypothetical protein
VEIWRPTTAPPSQRTLLLLLDRVVDDDWLTIVIRAAHRRSYEELTNDRTLRGKHSGRLDLADEVMHDFTDFTRP